MLNRLALGLAVTAAALALLTILLLPHGASAAAPANDDKADASIVVALPFSDSFNNSDATTETDEPKNCYFTATVWYKLTSPVTGRIVVETYGSDFDTGLAVYTQANDLIICNDDYSGAQSSLGFDAQVGQVYWVQAGGYNGRAGNMVVNIAAASDYAKITGTVRSAPDSMPLEGICLNVESPTLQRRGFTQTAADGTYTIEGLLADDYILSFDDCNHNFYAGSFYNDAMRSADAQVIHLTTGQSRTGVDADLPVGGTLSGKVTDADTDLPIEGICVYANSADYTFESSGRTAADGTYTIAGLGNYYKLQFENCGSSGPQYVSEYYPHGFDQDLATEVLVHPGEMRTGFDIALQIGGAISGTFTNGITGKPLTNACVSASRVVGSNLDYVTSDSANSDGTYTLGGLPAGQFKLEAYDCGGPAFADVWYDGKPSSVNATVVTLTIAQVRTGFDFSITPDPVAGDGDCTGDVTMSDLMTGLQFLSGVDEGPDCAATLLNLDCNAGTSARDMLVLVRFLAGLPMTVPADCPAPGDLLP